MDPLPTVDDARGIHFDSETGIKTFIPLGIIILNLPRHPLPH